MSFDAPSQFRCDLVLRSKSKDREVIDETVSSRCPVRQYSVTGLVDRASKFPLRIELAIESAGSSVDRSDIAVGHLSACVVIVIECRNRQFLERRADRLMVMMSFLASVNQRRCLTDRRTGRAELLVVNARAVRPVIPTDRAVLRVTEARTSRAYGRFVARLEGRERRVRLECRQIRRCRAHLERLGRLRYRDRLRGWH